MAVKNSVEELGLCVLHIGINAEGEEDGRKMAEEFRTLMGFVPDENPDSIFASPLVEIMKFGGPGAKGHIAIGAHDVDKAAEYFQSTGMGIKPETAKYNEDGTLKFIYLAKEIGGFAIHLKQY